MAVFQFAAPILPGKLDSRKAFNKEIQGSRKAEMDAVQKKAGVTRKLASLQQTPHGEFAVVMIEGDDPVAFMREIAQATDDLGEWFKGAGTGEPRHGPGGPASTAIRGLLPVPIVATG